MKIGILREGKMPPDKRVPLTPEQCLEVQKKFPGVKVIVQPSKIRCFKDDEFSVLGIQLKEDLNECDILLGVKEVPIDELIPDKKYFFFSHTIKKQEYNRNLLQTILKKKIQLIDYETLNDINGFRIIGFGRFAGLVGAYSGLRAFGLRNKLFDIKPAHHCDNLDELFSTLDTVKLPPIKIAVTGDGRVSGGVVEILNHMKLMRVTPKSFLKEIVINEPVFTQLLPQNYVERMDGSPFDLMHFFNHPEMYKNAFLQITKVTDILIASAYWDPKSPVLFTVDDMKKPDFKISVISDITCDIEGSIPSTKRAATIDEPFYDYNPETEKLEPAFSSADNVTVQAVDNLPCELPVDASFDFGQNLIDKVFPSLFNEDVDGIIDRASITKNGKLTDQYSYLKEFAEK